MTRMLLVVAAIAACGGDQRSTTPTTPTQNAAATPAPPPPAAPAEEPPAAEAPEPVADVQPMPPAGGSTSPPANPATPLPRSCDRYGAAILAFSHCEKLPAESRQAMRDAYDAMNKGWASVGEMPPEMQVQMEEACKQGVDGLQQAAAAMGCTI